MIKKIVLMLLILGALSTFLEASDNLGDILIPYDDNGFYGGSIIILLLIYIGIPFVLMLSIGGLIASFLFPKIIQEFKLLIELYYTMKLKKALSKHFVHILIFTPITLFFLYLIHSQFETSSFYLSTLLVFLYSSFFGLYVFLYAIMALYFKNWKKVLIALILGGGIFIFFASSGYFVFEPIYSAYLENKKP